MERRWIVCSFLDLTGFRSWTYRASTAPEMKVKFIDDFYRVLQDFVTKNVIPRSKYQGDGILITCEFSDTERKKQSPIVSFVKELQRLYLETSRVIRNSENSPGGARIRIMDGYVYKIMVIDPNDPERKRLIPEYLEYCTNTARGLLDVNPEIPCLATDSLVKNLGKGGAIFKPRALISPSCYPKGVNKEDVDGLHVLKF